VNQQLDLQAELQLLETLDNLFGSVPVLGKIATRLTKSYFDVKGPWADANVGLTPARQVTAPVREILNVPNKMLDSIKPKRQ
jgi:hypothetical protein